MIAIYALLSEKVLSCRRAYNTWATLALDLLMIIFWLAAMAGTANRRSKFTVDVTASCTSDGSAINSGQCTILGKRVVGVASDSALGILSGIAALSAFEMLLFVPTFAYVCHYFRLANFGSSGPVDPEKSGAASAGGGVAGGPGATELQAGMPHSQPLLNQQPGQQQWAQQPTGYPQQQQVAPAYDPYTQQQQQQQNTAYTGAYPSQQQPYSPQGTPAPGHQPYAAPQDAGYAYSPQATPAPGQPYQPPYQHPQ